MDETKNRMCCRNKCFENLSRIDDLFSPALKPMCMQVNYLTANASCPRYLNPVMLETRKYWANVRLILAMILGKFVFTLKPRIIYNLKYKFYGNVTCSVLYHSITIEPSRNLYASIIFREKYLTLVQVHTSDLVCNIL